MYNTQYKIWLISKVGDVWKLRSVAALATFQVLSSYMWPVAAVVALWQHGSKTFPELQKVLLDSTGSMGEADVEHTIAQ